jgi:YidC/Oxa1 family membrane protein insertase
MMREKMKVAKPDIDAVQEKVKRSRTQEEKMAANQEMMEVYKKYDMNPMKSMLGCLPVLIQMPVIMGSIFRLEIPIYTVDLLITRISYGLTYQNQTFGSQL